MRNTILTIVAALALTGCIEDGPEATHQGQIFAKQMLGWDNASVACLQYDTDGDGYVSCTAANNDSKEIVAIECTGAYSWNDGCRLATGKGANVGGQ